MASGKSLELAEIQPVVHRYLTPRQYTAELIQKGKVSGNKLGWPKGGLPSPRRVRRRFPKMDSFYYPKGRPRARSKRVA